jgi:hypothetical protein
LATGGSAGTGGLRRRRGVGRGLGHRKGALAQGLPLASPAGGPPQRPRPRKGAGPRKGALGEGRGPLPGGGRWARGVGAPQATKNCSLCTWLLSFALSRGPCGGTARPNHARRTAYIHMDKYQRILDFSAWTYGCTWISCQTASLRRGWHGLPGRRALAPAEELGPLGRAGVGVVVGRGGSGSQRATARPPSGSPGR